MKKIEQIVDTLPGLDCGSCGAPSCHALAEDIVAGMANEGDCVFKLREKISNLFDEMSKLQFYVPPPSEISWTGSGRGRKRPMTVKELSDKTGMRILSAGAGAGNGRWRAAISATF
jgi:Na+-translocating ferredoxin:NAD+ oxidoreductase RNF subunit RnfB